MDARSILGTTRAVVRLGLASWIGLMGSVSRGATPTSPEFFTASVRPLLTEYCLKCHSAEKHKGDLNLEQFSTVAEVIRHPKTWQAVIEQLSNGEMPPKDKPQPTDPQRQQLISWADAVLDEIASAQAGDPGPVVLRRLSNAEYTCSVRDLTRVESLDPAREFPVDGAAGEGFVNVGNSLVMSPSLVTKYLDAGKEIAAHAVLLPNGIRFSSKTTRRDWTEEILAEIRSFYRGYTDPRGGDKVNLQGIVFETNEGGRIPVEKYLLATFILRDGGAQPQRIEAIARERNLSSKYLRLLFDALNGGDASGPLGRIRTRWREASAADAAALAASIGQWQKALWKFSSVGHIGKVGGPKAWLEPVSPLTATQELRFKMPSAPSGKELTVYLVAGDAGDGNEHDFVVWQQPRFVAPGRPPLLLRDVRALTHDLSRQREKLLSKTAQSLAAAAEAQAGNSVDFAELSRKHDVDPEILKAWFGFLGIEAGAAARSSPQPVLSYFTNKMTRGSGYEFINGWGSAATPNLVANSSGEAVRIPGKMKPHSVAVHPSPTLQAGIGWRCPAAATVNLSAVIEHAHPECGNGVTWSVELRRGGTRQRLVAGTAQGAAAVKPQAIENLAVQPGDLISVLIGPRDGNHSCDLTAVDLTVRAVGDGGREWDLARDVSPDVLAGNPHADRFGNAAVWHFYTEPDRPGSENGPTIPAGSLLAKWQITADPGAKQKIATDLQNLLVSGPPPAKESPDQKLYSQLTSLGGPLFATLRSGTNQQPRNPSSPGAVVGPEWAVDPGLFGKSAAGDAIDPASIEVHAPFTIEVRLPADLVAGWEFVTGGVLDQKTGAEGTVQLQILTNKTAAAGGLMVSAATAQAGKGTWTDADKPVVFDAPILVNEGSAAGRRLEDSFKQFRDLFPAALCYTKIVPVDEVVTLTLYHREDQHLARLMLNEVEQARLDRLWNELHFVSQDALLLVDVFEQLWQYATQDADPKVFEPLREPIKQRAAAFRESLLQSEPRHVDAVLQFAEAAYRRPLASGEQQELRELYRKLRKQELPHDEAIRLLVARVLVAPAFLYHAEQPGPGFDAVPVSAWELASRLSYFLWSSVPDGELRQTALDGTLLRDDVLVAQTRRMLRDGRVRRLATEFGCAWLQIHGFDELSEKSERHFPTFNTLRGAMYEESIRFFTDLFQNDRSVTAIVDADYTFVNGPLAAHYGIPGVTGPEWRRIDGAQKYSRGGILAQAATLAKQSGASRTSPILRGNWVTEVLLGERLPRPPKDVPRLPEDEAGETLTVRQLTERHTADPKCFGCHKRIDPYGYALEAFDAIGRHRSRDLGDRPIDTHVKAIDGAEFDGLDGLRHYLLNERRDAFLRQFSRKLLGYSLGRAVQLSDNPLLADIRSALKTNDFRVTAAIEKIVLSPQFRRIRGKEMLAE